MTSCSIDESCIKFRDSFKISKGQDGWIKLSLFRQC